MDITGTLINYYFHCKRQCYLHGNKLNLEDNSELVQIGRAQHEVRAAAGNTEIEIEHIKLDRLTREYLTEMKKSDADVEAAKWQTLYYLKILKEKGILRKGKIEFLEKNKIAKKTIIVELGEEEERQLDDFVKEIGKLIDGDTVPNRLEKAQCKKCAYYEYCYIV